MTKKTEIAIRQLITQINFVKCYDCYPTKQEIEIIYKALADIIENVIQEQSDGK